MKQVSGLLIGVIGILVFALILNIAISIYQPTAVKNAVEATQTYNQTVGGVEYQFEGTGDDPQQAGQDAVDSMNVIRTTANVLLGIVLLVLAIFGVVGFFKKQ